MKIALVVHQSNQKAAAVAAEATAAAARLGLGIVEGDLGTADVVIAIGGDGTVLHALGRAVLADVPVLGINVGNIGFLAEVTPDRVSEALMRLTEGEYGEVTRMTAIATADGVERTAVNDVVVEKRDSSRAVRVEVAIDGELLTTYRADGVVVATPTGSTAYAFSAGGPVMDASLDGFVIVPVAAHNLFSRPVVATPDAEITLRPIDRPAQLDVDGNAVSEIAPESTVAVRRGPRRARFVTFGGNHFLTVLRGRFGISP